MPNKILLRVLFRGCRRPSLSVQGRSDRSGFLFEGMLTRNQRGSPPVFFIWLHQQLSVGQHHVTETSQTNTITPFIPVSPLQNKTQLYSSARLVRGR